MDEIKQYESLFKGKKILFLMPSLSAGGAERVMVTIIKNLDRTKYCPLLVILEEGINPLNLEDLGCNVELVNLKISNARYSLFALYQLIKFRNPDTVISTLGYVNEILSILIPFLPKSIRFVARESSIPSMRNKADNYSALHNWLYNKPMKKFDNVVCQSQEMYSDLVDNYGFTKEQLVLIDNPVDEEFVLRKSKEKCVELEPNFYNVLAVGSLKKVKNYDLLIQEAEKSPEHYRYWIIGEGDERGVLEAQIKANNLSEKVVLLGHQINPWKFMANADEFWQKSHWEGNSNAKKEWDFLQKGTT